MSAAIDSMIKRLTDRQRHEFLLKCARRVQHIMRDPRSIAALDTRERWLRGEATDEEMSAAADAAASAAAAAASVAVAVAASAVVAVEAADAARAAAWAAAAVARPAARAAWAAAAAARAAARAAAGAAAGAAADAAWDVERAWQRGELERMLKEGGGACGG